MKTALFLVIFCLGIDYQLLSQDLNGDAWEFCPKSNFSNRYEVKNMPSNCKFDWEITNGFIYDGQTKIGTKLSATSNQTIYVKWEEPDYDYSTTTLGQFPTGLVRVTSVGCAAAGDNGKTIQGKVTIKSVKGYKIPSIRINNNSYNNGSQVNFTATTSNITVDMENLPVIFPPNSVGYSRTIYPSQFYWTLPEGWTDDSGRTGSFTAGPHLLLVPPCWGYTAGSTKDLKVSFINPEGCLIGTSYQKSAEYIAKIQKDAPYVTGITSSKTSINWGETSNFSLTATINIPGNYEYIWNLPNGYIRTTTASTGQIITTSPDLDVTSNGCNTSEKISVFIRSNCGSSGLATKEINYTYPGSIIGPDRICDKETYTVNNLPSGASVVWSSSSVLSLTSTQSVNPGIFSAAGSGDAWIKATITPLNCPTSSRAVQKTRIWVGGPIMQGVSGNTTVCPSPVDYYWFTAQSLGADRYQWWIPGEAIAYNNYLDGQTLGICFDSYCYIPGSRYITVWAFNECGQDQQDVYLVIPEYCACNFSFSPNPASDYITVNMNQTQNNISALSSSDKSLSIASQSKKVEVYTIRVLNNQGVPVITTKKSDIRFTIPVSGLQNGTYIIEVSDGKTIYKKQFVVKH